jgi:aminoglycoside phosphotransferase
MQRDTALPALEVLLGSDARDLIEAAVGAAGGRVLHYDRRQVLYRPGHDAAVRYGVDVVWGDGTERRETVVAVVGVDGPPAGSLVLEAGDLQVGVFRYPYDPALPGLPDATIPGRAAELLGSPVDDLEVLAYRPGRRAVVRAVTGDGTRYVKVLRPRGAGSLAAVHTALAGTVPVPPVVVDASDRGLLVLGEQPGRTLRSVLVAGDVTDAPPVEELVDLLRRLDAAAPAIVSRPARRSVIGDASAHGALLASAVPSSRRRIERLVARLGTDDAPRPDAFVHGDFHAAQVMVDGGRVTGLLDLDDAGRGARADDLATFLAHLAIVDSPSPALRAYADDVLAAFDALADPADLRRRVAAVLVGLATGPFRVQERRWRAGTLRRLGLAERWLASAGEIDRGATGVPASA